jgi:tetratricopeptide (TPR) repeat protein
LADLTRGNWDRAEVLMTEALRLERASGVPGSGAMALQALSSAARLKGDLELSERRAVEALALFRAVGHDSGAALALATLAQVATDRGNDRQALAAYREALSLWAGMGERWLIVQALAGLAALAATHGSPEHAATLVGATDSQLDEVGTTLISRDRVLYDQAASSARAALGEARFAAMRDAGRTLPMREVVAAVTSLSISDGSEMSGLRTDAGC